jgi:UDP-N-acetylmuramate--alanine ligase
MDQFAESFDDADEVIVPNVYAARETDDQKGDAGSEELVSRICRGGGRARYLPTLDEVTEHVSQHMTEGDLVLTMGAGDVWKVADALVDRIREPNRV